MQETDQTTGAGPEGDEPKKRNLPVLLPKKNGNMPGWVILGIIVLAIAGAFVVLPWLLGVFGAFVGVIFGIIGGILGLLGAILGLLFTAFLFLLPALVLIGIGYAIAVLVRRDRSGGDNI